MALSKQDRDGPILIVVPRPLLSDWKNSITRCVNPTPRLCVYCDARIQAEDTSTTYTADELENFDVYFLLRKQKATQKLNQDMTAVLAATLRAVKFRLRITDKFDDQPVATFQPGVTTEVKHLLTLQQQDFQERVQHIWDINAKMEAKSNRKRGLVDSLSVDETFLAMTTARLAAVHASCATAKYGDAGVDDAVKELGSNGLIDVEGTPIQLAYRGRQNNKTKATHAKVVMNRNNFIRDHGRDWYESPRIVHLVKIVQQHLRRREVDQGVLEQIPADICKDLRAAKHECSQNTKIIIYSEFLSALDVADVALARVGYTTVRYDGWLSEKDKEVAKNGFLSDSIVDILLMTIRSGGVGLNLPVASVVIHLTPCWNPALTVQCNSRAIRPGQLKFVQVVYFHSTDSLERVIRDIANSKAVKASEVIDPGPETSRSIADMAFHDKENSFTWHVNPVMFS
ncbi:hypothetical protein PTNB85_05912 [Pyrenophora teres f. teres]|nr:hypothetical protein HRS9139_08593 [Pyrenophora teres f. teres]KAE8834579.1 hypothetical protein PTNB85_05912 [Pyrenophora teres f. teres]